MDRGTEARTDQREDCSNVKLSKELIFQKYKPSNRKKQLLDY